MKFKKLLIIIAVAFLSTACEDEAKIVQESITAIDKEVKPLSKKCMQEKYPQYNNIDPDKIGVYDKLNYNRHVQTCARLAKKRLILKLEQLLKEHPKFGSEIRAQIDRYK